MSKSGKILIMAAVLVSALTLGLSAVVAQEEPDTAAVVPEDQATAEEAFSPALEAPVVESAAAQADNTAGAEILGVGEPKLLPSSPFYFFKEIGRGISNAFTFSEEKRAEKKLDQASERLAEVEIMMSETTSEDAGKNKTIANSLTKYQKDIDKANASIEKVEKDSNAYNNLINKAVDKYSAFAKVMAADEDLALDIDKDIVQEIYKSKEGVLNNLAGSIENLPDSSKLEEILQNQSGSDFKEFKNLEVLGELEGKLPEQAAEAVSNAQDKIRAKMEEKLSASTEGKTGEDFANYVIALKGNQAEHMAILDELSKSEDLPDEVADGFRKAKDAAAINFSKKMINHPAAEQMMEEIASGDIDKLRVLEEMADALPDYSEVKAELEQAREKALGRAAEKMDQIESVDDKISFLIKDGVPDAKSFVILDQLQGKFTPEQQEKMAGVRNKAFQIFSDIVDNSENSEKLLERLSGDSPKDIELIAAIRENLPADVAPKFEILAKKQLAKVEDRIMNEDNMEKLMEMRDEMSDSPKAQEFINKYAPEMEANINKKQFEKVSAIFDQTQDPAETIELANKYNSILDKYPAVEEMIKKTNPELIASMVEKQSKKIRDAVLNAGSPEEMENFVKNLESAGMDKFSEYVSADVNNAISKAIIDRTKTVQKEEFLNKVKSEAGDSFDQAAMEKVFDEEIGSQIGELGVKPDAANFEKISNTIREKVSQTMEVKAREKAEQEMQTGIIQGGGPSGATTGPSAEAIKAEVEKRMPADDGSIMTEQQKEKIRQDIQNQIGGQIGDQMKQKAQEQMPAQIGGQAPANIPTNIQPPTSIPTGPSAEEIEKIKAEQMQNSIPQSLGPTPEQLQQMQGAPR